MTFDAIKARYRAAFQAYHEIMKRNAETSRGGQEPCADDVERETQALRVLADARRALFAAIVERTIS
jgi:hypothetical protein